MELLLEQESLVQLLQLAHVIGTVRSYGHDLMRLKTICWLMLGRRSGGCLKLLEPIYLIMGVRARLMILKRNLRGARLRWIGLMMESLNHSQRAQLLKILLK
jgi:hypothetical protein